MSDREERVARHWRMNQRIIAVLLVVWFLVTFVVAYFARELSRSFFGWPFSFWVAAQGALIVYMVLIWIYGRAMNRLDRKLRLAEDD